MDGGEWTEPVPALVEALVEKKVIGATAGYWFQAVWTDAGELFTYGSGLLGHGLHWSGSIRGDSELIPRLVEALAGKR